MKRHLDALLGDPMPKPTDYRRLIAAGVAVHCLKPRSKAPVDTGWSTAPKHTLGSLIAAHREGQNFGIRLGEPSLTPAGYLHVLDLDINDPAHVAQAKAALRELLPEWEECPRVISGSGGDSRHVLFFTDKPFRSRKLAQSPGWTMVHDKRLGRDVKKHHWEIELFGTGKQVATVPSIHPDTGLPYRWERPIDFDLLMLGIAPSVAAARVEAWGATADKPEDGEDDDDLLAVVCAEPLGLTEEEIDRTLADLPPHWVEERDYWFKVGMALHHEMGGTREAFDKWCNWSRQSEKFELKDSKAVWKSFKGKTKRPVRMATLIQASAANRLRREHLALGAAGDLLGPSPGDVQVPEAWVRDKRGYKVWCAANAQRVLAHDPQWQGVLAFDEFNQVVMLTARIPGTRGRFAARELTDSDVTAATAWFNRNGFPTASEAVTRATIYLVARDSIISPVRHYLEGIAWDGEKRIDTWLTCYLGAEDTPYVRAVGRAWLISAVARAMKPGCQADHMLVLEGSQGIGKSTCAQVLCGEAWFSDSLPDMHSKDASVALRGKWIIEVAELSAMRRADFAAVKAFVSRRQERYRPPYGRAEVSEPRRCVFIGTMNPDGNGYLRDDTGGRRFWPVATTRADAKAIARDRDQLWAEAVAAFKDGSPWWLDDATAALAAVEQAERMETDPWIGAVLSEAELIAGQNGGAVSVRRILSQMGVATADMTKPQQMRVAGILTRAGWRKDGKFKERGLDRDSAKYWRP
jgi:predicted P-loop ATPase